MNVLQDCVEIESQLNMLRHSNDDLKLGPWQFGDLNHPLSVHHLKGAGFGDTKAFIQKKSQGWQETGKRVFAGRAVNTAKFLFWEPHAVVMQLLALRVPSASTL